ncbi:hypothetical protein [Desulfallas thermosapovorans]|uniref:Uncharacterized protein n=1 Tax=Desulfallas thermosapovorans DSM 6562 TaxID=1121431 RepID=A0A5S4ZR99_9FIRM|nr:hypothetical protein [Desulfallas thermosapovorans]TYO95149.1 hypothetical protein LX24_01878 [Desulfallas thermosapovorans DSM 6562]
MSRPAPKINPKVAARIRAREAEALAAGWAFGDLWESRFWHLVNRRNRPGLAALMRPGDKLGAITKDYIEIVHRSGAVNKFYHPDRDKPGEKRVVAGA